MSVYAARAGRREVSPEPGRLTRTDLWAQPRFWVRVRDQAPTLLDAVDAVWRARGPGAVYFTGCGSSFYLALVAADLWRAILRIPCEARPASELSFLSDEALDALPPALLVAISRSGQTTETLWAVRRFRDCRVPTAALTCEGEGVLAQTADVTLALPVEEGSVVMTASFTSMLALLATAASHLAGHPHPADGLGRAAALVEAHLPDLAERAAAVARHPLGAYVFLGSGPWLGIAYEGALKMCEMALVPACAHAALEFLHGPRAIAGPDVGVVGLVGGPGAAYQEEVLRHAAVLGSPVASVGANVADVPSVPFPSGISELEALLMACVWVQLLALEVAARRGVNPDSPRHLQRVVTWNGARIPGGGI